MMDADSRVGSHPEPEELLAYSSGETPKERSEEIEAHLVSCFDCAQTILDLASFPEVELRDQNLRRTTEEEDADWRAIRERLVGEKRLPRPSAIRRLIRPAQFSSPTHKLAAGLLLAVVGLSSWIVALRHQVQTLSEPHVNVYAQELTPVAKDDTRDRSSSGDLSVPADKENLLLILALGDFEDFSDYRITLERRGATAWERAGITRNPDGSLSIVLPRSSLLPGPYSIRVYGLAAGGWKPLATYQFTISYNAKSRPR
ncbi:MAG TPA: hypothetical protein VF179_15110 [Thermoanaerobaculia bacterium]|nr:hypothetical protein [Thermoanaerobaculia bacterium]